MDTYIRYSSVPQNFSTVDLICLKNTLASWKQWGW